MKENIEKFAGEIRKYYSEKIKKVGWEKIQY
jgi:hypothetical protein